MFKRGVLYGNFCIRYNENGDIMNDTKANKKGYGNHKGLIIIVLNKGPALFIYYIKQILETKNHTFQHCQNYKSEQKT